MEQFSLHLGKAASATLLLAASVCLLARPAEAQVYKWVDAQGVTHYDSSPPPGAAANSKTLAISTAPAATTSSDQSWQEKDNAFKSRYDKRKADEAAQDDKDKKAMASRQSLCNKAQNRLEFLETNDRIYHMDNNGNRIFMSDQQHDQELAVARQAIAENCHG